MKKEAQEENKEESNLDVTEPQVGTQSWYRWVEEMIEDMSTEDAIQWGGELANNLEWDSKEQEYVIRLVIRRMHS